VKDSLARNEHEEVGVRDRGTRNWE